MEKGSNSDADVSNFTDVVLPVEKRGDDIKKENGSISDADVASAFSHSSFANGFLPMGKRGDDIEKENGSISDADVASAFSHSNFPNGFLPMEKRGDDIEKENGSISDADVVSAFSQSNFTNGVFPIEKRGEDIEKENGSISAVDVTSAFSQSNFTGGVLPIEKRGEDIEKENGDEAVDSNDSNLTRFPEEVMSLSLAGLEAILSSDDLQVASEDAVFDIVLKWARKHYGNLEERQEVLGARLARLIRFPYMTSQRLKKVLTCSDFDHEVASKLVREALLFKVEAPHPVWSLAAEESASLNCPFKERAYKYHPVKVVKFKLPRQQCVVYMDLKREVCANLFPSGRVYSQPIYFGGLGFFLSAQCNMNQQSSFHCFGLLLGTLEKCPVSFNAELEFAARSRPTEEFVYKYKGNYTLKGGKAIGYPVFFAIPWTSFMAGDCAYFINDVLHLRAKLTIKD